ncbi:phosphohydrolase [Yersinia phage fHe-Yen9-02]|nr:phosphohydrolase [Yersinia phage fHe-Yen9-02]
MFHPTAKMRSVHFQHMINSLELQAMWDYIQENNISGSSDNYHSTEHMAQVALIAHEILRYEPHVGKESPEETLFITVVACLFHDMGHSLGDQTDEYNIMEAIISFRIWCRQPSIGTRFFLHAAAIESAIRITEFPYSDKRKPITLSHKVIRDADILYGLQFDSRSTVLHKLRKEMARSKPVYTDMSHTDYVNSRIDFLRTVELFTQYGTELFNAQIAPHTAAIISERI